MIEQLHREPDIFRIYIPLPQNPLRNLNCYIVTSQGETLIIDTGFRREECRDALFSGLRELSIDLNRTSLFLTHLHSDHCGLAEYLTELGVPAYMNAIDYDYLRENLIHNRWQEMEKIFRLEGFPVEEMKRQQSGNQARRYSPSYLFPVTTIQDGDFLHVGDLRFRCIHTPGHTPGHTCLYLEQEKLFFSGDHVLFDITPNISIWYQVPSSLADYLDSLQKVKALSVTDTFPAHRECIGDLYQRIDRLTAHHQARLAEILTAVADYPDSTAYDTAGRITWSARGRAWIDFPPNQRWFAVGETLAHLKWLLDHGHIARREDGRYRAVTSPAEFVF